MDDDRRHGSLARRLFVLIGPPSVIGERGAGEKFRIVGRRLVREHHHDFAAHVDARIIVPLIFGRCNSVPHENRIGIETRVGLLLIGDADEIVQPAKFYRTGAHLGRRLRIHAHQRQVLKVRPVIAGRFGPGHGELAGEVFGGQVASARADASPFKQIAGQKFHMSAHPLP